MYCSELLQFPSRQIPNVLNIPNCHLRRSCDWSCALDSGEEPGGIGGPDPALEVKPLVDVAGLLRRAAFEGGLPQTLPWLVRFLWFLPADQTSLRAAYYQVQQCLLLPRLSEAKLPPVPMSGYQACYL